MTLPREISFIVSQNDKGDNPKRPDYRGEVVIGGQKYELAAWKRKKEGTNRQFVSGKLTLKGEQGPDREAPEAERRDPPPRAASSDNLDEDVPF